MKQILYLPLFSCLASRASAFSRCLFQYGAFVAFLLVFLIFGGCDGQAVSIEPMPQIQQAPQAVIFRHDGSVQCDTEFQKKISMINARALLNNKGIDVIETGCGELDAFKGPAVCGAPSANVNLFTIPESSLVDVTGIGFSKQQSDEPIRVIECPQGASTSSLFD